MYASTATVARIAAYFNRYVPTGIHFEAEPTPPQFGSHGTLWVFWNGRREAGFEASPARVWKYCSEIARTGRF